MSAWYENDTFWSGAGPLMFTPERWEAAARDVEQLIELTGISSGAAVLDLPCGPGRHSLEFARRGCRVTGVDRTASYLDEARQKAATEKLAVDWVAADMREFCRPAAYDVALNLYSSFGYFADPADDRRVVENFLASLKPGGRLVLEVKGKECLARVFQPMRAERLPDGRVFLQEGVLSDDWSWIETRWSVLDGARRTDYELGNRLYSAAELKQLLAHVGFVQPRAFASFTGAPYDHTATRLVVVAEKPAT